MKREKKELIPELETLINNLQTWCTENEFPMIVSVLTDAENNKYRTAMLSPEVIGVYPKGQDCITDCLKVFNGCVPVLPEIKHTIEGNLNTEIGSVEIKETDGAEGIMDALLM